MKRILIPLLLVAAVIAVVLLAFGGDEGDEGYQVRAVFDNGGFMVTGEQVRVAGANVGEISAVEVSMPGDTVAYHDDKAVEEPGKAVIVMEITDPGFQDFRIDGGCHIRPQSLIGEKFVDCRPTLPRAPGSPPAPALKQIPDGENGAGQYLLPLGNNSASVDPDLINDIQSLPYAQRFRLILNELGAGFAGRGEDIEEVIKRANPVLRDVDRLFAILTAQRDELAQLTSDSDEILKPFARERASVAGFITNSGAAAQASSELGSDVEESFSKFPAFLREFRQTMSSLKGFSDVAAPVFSDLGKAAPSLTDATRTLTPFSEASTVALKSLGATGEIAGPKLREADPVVRKGRELAKSGAQPTTELAELFVSIEKTEGWDGLVELIYNTNAAVNGFDQYGHFVRTMVIPSNCLQYEMQETSGCASKFTGREAPEGHFVNEGARMRALFRRLDQILSRGNGGVVAGDPATVPALPDIGDAGEAAGADAEPEAGVSAAEGTAPLIDYLLGP